MVKKEWFWFANPYLYSCNPSLKSFSLRSFCSFFLKAFNIWNFASLRIGNECLYPHVAVTCQTSHTKWFVNVRTTILQFNHITIKLTWISLTLLLITPEFLSALIISFSVNSPPLSILFPVKMRNHGSEITTKFHKCVLTIVELKHSKMNTLNKPYLFCIFMSNGPILWRIVYIVLPYSAAGQISVPKTALQILNILVISQRLKHHDTNIKGTSLLLKKDFEAHDIPINFTLTVPIN